MKTIPTVLRCAASVIALAALLLFAVGGASAHHTADHEQGGGNPDPGCVTGNPSAGSECEGGNNNQAGGGVGCAGGSNADREEPCGRGTGDTLNNQGNVPGCTSQGNAVNQNPHCAGNDNGGPPPDNGNGNPPPDNGNGNPPPDNGNGNPPPDNGKPPSNGATDGPGTTTGGVLVTSLPSTGAGHHAVSGGAASTIALILGGLAIAALAALTVRRGRINA